MRMRKEASKNSESPRKQPGEPTIFSGKSDETDEQNPAPYNRGWETQPNSRGLYTHYKDSLLKVG